jgi:CheY-like chemotaxis protein
MNLHGFRILVVEDTEEVAEFIRALLTKAGCEVIGPIGSVTECLNGSELQACDAAVLDVNLPDGKIYPVVDALRSQGVPHMFLTAMSPSEVAPEYRDVKVLRKPFESSDLVDTLAVLCLKMVTKAKSNSRRPTDQGSA